MTNDTKTVAQRSGNSCGTSQPLWRIMRDTKCIGTVTSLSCGGWVASQVGKTFSFHETREEALAVFGIDR